MSSDTLSSAIQRVADATVEVAWNQWRAIGAAAASGRRAHAIVDPEALLLLSLYLSDREPRLGRFVSWWAAVGARVLSVQRVKNLLPGYEAAVIHDRLSGFARLAIERGKDARWRALANGAALPPPRDKDVAAGPSYGNPAALLLRLRVGLGVGIKADVLTLLLGRSGSRETVQGIAAATGYAGRAVRRAVEDMAAARLVRSWQTTPASFSADAEVWGELLGFEGGAPPWRYWQSVFALVFALLEWWRAESASPSTPYLRSSAAREIISGHREAFERNTIRVPRTDDYVGEEYLPAFEQSLATLLEWMENGL